MIKDYIVLGAGLSGLHCAKKIKEQNLGSVFVVEKSRGVGGRMATRRTLDTRFDHGAQFYRLKEDIASLHQFWKDKEVTHSWFNSLEGKHWCANLGMTALAKSISTDLEIGLEKQINSITYENNLWKISTDKNEQWFCRNLILSSPLPQSIKLLEGAINHESFNLEKFSELKKIEYTKALIALVVLEEEIFINESGYIEFNSGNFFSIADQKRKGISEISAITITMSPQFSEDCFDQKDDETLGQILKKISTQFPEIKVKSAELKKWRYCRPMSQDKNLFCEMASNLFLIGDAFGGSSLLGAVRSSEGLCQYLLRREQL
jgi:predicted NAD/FAD-dependent oxidoreductase